MVEDLSVSKMEGDMPLGYFDKKYPKEMNEIRKQLLDYVPVDLSFRDAYKKASQAISQERSFKKKNLKNLPLTSHAAMMANSKPSAISISKKNP